MAWTGPECLPSLMVTNVNTGVTMRADEAAKQYGGVDLGSTGDLQPMLGLGSNASPFQLARKFGKSGHAIPVLQCVLAGWDVVYAAHVSFYGSATATLAPCPGAAVEVALLLLDENQAAAMDATEGGHDLCYLTGIELHVARSLEEMESGELLPGETYHHVLAYLHNNGVLAPQLYQGAPESPIALAGVRASGSTFPALSQQEMLQWVHDTWQVFTEAEDLAPDGSQQSGSASAASGSSGPDWPSNHEGGGNSTWVGESDESGVSAEEGSDEPSDAGIWEAGDGASHGSSDGSSDGSSSSSSSSSGDDLDLWVLRLTDDWRMRWEVTKLMRTMAQPSVHDDVLPLYMCGAADSKGKETKRRHRGMGKK